MIKATCCWSTQPAVGPPNLADAFSRCKVRRGLSTAPSHLQTLKSLNKFHKPTQSSWAYCLLKASKHENNVPPVRYKYWQKHHKSHIKVTHKVRMTWQKSVQNSTSEGSYLAQVHSQKALNSGNNHSQPLWATHLPLSILLQLIG